MEKMISMNELYKYYQNLSDQDLILDVRTPEEWQQFHIPGSKNIPYDQLDNHVEELRKYQNIFIHCKMGGRARTALATLKQKGMNETNLFCAGNDGMLAWIDEGLPTE